MPRLTVLAALLVVLAVAPACRTTITKTRIKQVQDGALVVKDLRSYHVVYSEYQGKVGYLKVFDVREAGGPAYQWKYIYDLEFNELGFVDQYGKAYRYHRYPEFEAGVQKKSMRIDNMPADKLENNVMRMLDIDPAMDDVSFPVAGKGDLG